MTRNRLETVDLASLRSARMKRRIWKPKSKAMQLKMIKIDIEGLKHAAEG